MGQGIRVNYRVYDPPVCKAASAATAAIASRPLSSAMVRGTICRVYSEQGIGVRHRVSETRPLFSAMVRGTTCSCVWHRVLRGFIEFFDLLSAINLSMVVAMTELLVTGKQAVSAQLTEGQRDHGQ